MRPRHVVIFTLEKHAAKSHLPKLILRAGRSDISGPERGAGRSTTEMKLVGVFDTYQILKFAYIFIHAVGWSASLYSPIKTLRQRVDSAIQKHPDKAQCFGNPPELLKLPR